MQLIHSPEDEEIPVLPWWQNPINLLALALSMLIFGLGLGYYWGDISATPTHNPVDEGFLQDTRYHHEQAIEISYFYLRKVGDPDPRLSQLAQEILFSQQLENGRMVQLLRNFGASEANDTGIAMSWMGHSIPIAEMDGLASPNELDMFAAATGNAASTMFATLMIAHHQGGIAMATYAIAHASNAEIKAMAASMIAGQRSEVNELQKILGTLPIS